MIYVVVILLKLTIWCISNGMKSAKLVKNKKTSLKLYSKTLIMSYGEEESKVWDIFMFLVASDIFFVIESKYTS